MTRRAYGAGAEPIPLLGVRLLVAAVLLLVLARVDWRRPHPCVPTLARADWPRPGRREVALLGLAGAAFGAAGLAEFEALARAAAPTVVLLVFVAPAWIALGAWLLRGEPLPWRTAAALAVMLGGLALLVAAPGGPPPDLAACGFALAASLASAVLFVALDALGTRARPPLAASGVAGIAAVAVVPVDPGGVAAQLTSGDTAPYGLAIGVLTACGLALLATGVRENSALAASAVICAEPVVAGVLSWLVLGEALTSAQLAGGVLVMASVAEISARGSPGRGATGRTTRPPRGSRPPPRPARSAQRRR